MWTVLVGDGDRVIGRIVAERALILNFTLQVALPKSIVETLVNLVELFNLLFSWEHLVVPWSVIDGKCTRRVRGYAIYRQSGMHWLTGAANVVFGVKYLFTGFLQRLFILQ